MNVRLGSNNGLDSLYITVKKGYVVPDHFYLM